MCHLCWTPFTQKYSRRSFIKQSLLAVTATTITACTPESSNIGDFSSAQQLSNVNTSRPIWAGQIGPVVDQQLLLTSPNSSQYVTITPNTEFRQENGQATKGWVWNQMLNRSVLVWADQTIPDPIATAVQLLPNISATDDLPTNSSQPIGTGETRPFGPLTLHTRAGWGAADTAWYPGGESGLYDPISNRNGWLVYDEPLKDQLHTAVIHHTALDFAQGAQMVQALHMTAARFADIGYHFVIDGLGELYEGRPLNVRGAHTAGFNTGYIGICLAGNFEIAPPIEAQLNTLRRLLAYLRETYFITHLGGHRDFQPGVTVCPGANLHPLLPQLAFQLGYTYQQG